MIIKTHKNIEQGSPEWHSIRAGKLTASCINEILTPAKLEPSKSMHGYACQLAVERITGKCVDGVKTSAMQKGSDLEPIAFDIYHNEFHPLKKVGFMKNSDVPFPFGASPDGLYVDKNIGVEIKCLSNPREYFDLLDGGAIAADRKLQMAGQMLAGGLEAVSFVIYIEGMKMSPRYYHRDEALISKIITAGEVLEELVLKLIENHNEAGGFLTEVIGDAQWSI